MSSSNTSFANLGQHVLRQFRELAVLTAYFYVAFATVILFKAAVLHSYGVRYIVWGAAIAKAILIAKFMLIGRAMKIGEGYQSAPLIKPILHKIFGFMFLLLVLTSIEELTVGLIHHRSFSALLGDIAGPRLGETLAEVLILLLALVPFIAFSVFAEALGEGTLRRMLFTGDTPRLVSIDNGDPGEKAVGA